MYAVLPGVRDVLNLSHRVLPARVESELQMACYVKGFCSLELTTAAGSPLGKTGNDSTSQLPVQTGNRDVSWQSPSTSLRTLLLPR